MTRTKKKVSFTEGPLFFKILIFTLPILATGLLQMLYTIADNIIVGRFSGDPNAIGAVGSTSSLTHLTINLLTGIAIGAGVVVAQAYGAKQDKVVSRAVHTSIVFSAVGGITFMLIGLLLSRPALELMGTRPELIDDAVLYFRIICLGIPATAIYNFGGAVLRSIGDSRTPLIILSSTGLVNVGLNVLFVLVFDMTVDGVAIATITSQYLSAVGVMSVLMKRCGENYGFSFKKLCFDVPLLKRILRYGIPSGIQSSLFSISNIMLTSGMNSLSNAAIKAHTITGNINSIAFIASNSFHQAATTFAGQNFGAKKIDRIRRVTFFCLIQGVLTSILVTQTELLFSDALISLYLDPSDPNKAETVALANGILALLMNTYFICGIMDVMTGVLKGFGRVLAPMISSLSCICVFRALWVSFAFPLEPIHNPTGLMACYPISWAMNICILTPLIIYTFRSVSRKFKAEEDTLS